MAGQEKPETAEMRFARRNALFRFRLPRPVTTGLLAGYGIFSALTAWAHWSLLTALGTVAGAGGAVLAVVGMWPRKVPGSLAGEVARLRDAGWHLRRRHLFWCTEGHPHAHMVMRAGPGRYELIIVLVPAPEPDAEVSQDVS